MDMTAASPQLMDLAGILHGLIAAYRPEGRADAQANTTTDAANTLPDTRTDLAITTEQQANLGVVQPGLAAAHLGKDGRPGTSDAAAIADTSDLTAREPRHAGCCVDYTGKSETRHRYPGSRQWDGEQAGAGCHAERFATNRVRRAGSRSAHQRRRAGKIVAGTRTQRAQGFFHDGSPVAGLPNTPMPLATVSAERRVAPAAGAFAHTGFGLEPRIGATGWDNALGQKVLWMVSNQQQVAELTLNPPDLGPLQVVLSVTNDQASATFISQHIDVRQALEAALPRLREMMADSGINLGETTVSAETSQRQGEFEQQDRSHARNGGNRETMSGPNIKSTDIGMGRTPAGGNRLVDTFA